MSVDDCLLCNEIILPDEATAPTMLLVRGSFTRRRMHVECALRNVIGGWGHIEDHAFWCKTIGDTDGGLTYRESARRVSAWVREHGVPTYE